MSNFNTDLSVEQILAEYLDEIYTELGYKFERIDDIGLQFKGVDLFLWYNEKKYVVDEKSQIHYLNKDLPTFTFELSYLNTYKKLKQGWLFDKSKTTQFYFLVTGIYLKNGSKLLNPTDISTIKITSVNRKKLIRFLEEIGLNYTTLDAYDTHFREQLLFGKNGIKELDYKKEGLLYFTEHLSEKPMNLQLRLQFLIEKGIAKKIFPK